MSTDWSVVCRSCKSGIHLGQRFTFGPVFGFHRDDSEGRERSGNFISEHIGHEPPLQILLTDAIPDDVEMDGP